MTLVERFIEINNWSASRKTALLSGLAFVFHFFAVLGQDYLYGQLPWIDLRLHDVIAWPWAASLALCCLISLAAARRGLEGRWTIPLLVLPYGFFTVCFIYAFGLVSTAYFAFYPLVVLLVTLWYGPRTGLLSLAYGLCLGAVVIWLISDPERSFAPLFLDRSLDAQRNLLFIATGFMVIMLVFAFCFTLVLFVVLAMRSQQARLDRNSQLIRRYVPSQIGDAILSGQQQMVEKYERRKLTIFFSDLVGFTEIAEELEPEDLSRVLNEYFSQMTAIAQKHGGTLDELSGDAILIFFGAPVATNDRDHALRAVRMATEMQQAMDALNATWRAAGITEAIRVRMGINTGVVTVGNFGSSDRMKYAALGKHVNLAARLQAHCEPEQILLSHATWLLINDEIPCTPKGEVQLKGIHKPVMIYELSGQA